MKLRRTARPSRGAFTLVELLVVIAIIAVLVALTAAAVMRTMRKGPEIQARNDISQLATAIQSFQTDFKVEYLPSRVRLYKNLAHYNTGTPGYEADSIQFLLRMWPRLKGRSYPPNTTPPQTQFYWVDWDGTGNPPVNSDPPIDLEGDQCLVFFLGGIPTYGPAGVSGFASDPYDPSGAASPGTPRRGPYYDGFKSDRLIQRSLNAGVNFYSFKDAYNQQPYAYFSSYKGQNGYLRYAGANIPGNTGSDCSTLSAGKGGPPSPYAEFLSVSSARFYNPNGFQIICAGLDGVFGRGSLASYSINDSTPQSSLSIWTPALAGATTATWLAKNPANALTATPAGWNLTAGNDDMTNFYDSALGVSR
jgi:prepilin-type N-terminal cleavage/methylation domain-containing protein